MTKSSVLFISFNRPDLTAVSIREILHADPPQLFLFSDGPRPGVEDDIDLIKQTRAILDHATRGRSGVFKRYEDTNLGLFRGVSGAIDWFFSEVEEGIILEDDCVPHPDFFGYCDELLNLYRENDQVWTISGDNSMALNVRGEFSYGFIRDPLIWGWATWRKAWEKYDREFSLWPKVRGTKLEKELFPKQRERAARRNLFDFYAGFENWDFKLVLTQHYYGGLTAVPRQNLISNVGMNRLDAIHTKGPSKRANFAVAAVLPLSHPEAVVVDKRAQRDFVEGRGLGLQRARLSYQILKRLRRLRRKIGVALSKLCSEDCQSYCRMDRTFPQAEYGLAEIPRRLSSKAIAESATSANGSII